MDIPTTTIEQAAAAHWDLTATVKWGDPQMRMEWKDDCRLRMKAALAALSSVDLCEVLRCRHTGLFVFMNSKDWTIDYAGGDLRGAKARLDEAVRSQKGA